MNPAGLKALAVAAYTQRGDKALVTLTVKGKWNRDQKQKRLFEGGPLCLIVGEHDGKLVVMCGAKQVIDAVDALVLRTLEQHLDDR